MQKIAIVSLLLLSSSAYAAEGDMWVNFHIGSKHSGDGYYKFEDNDGEKTPYEESNPGIGLEYEIGDSTSLVTGLYKNSAHSTSLYGGINFHSAYTNTVGLSLKMGVVTGYEDQYGSPVMLMLMPSLNFIAGPARIELSYLPGIGRMDSILGLTAGFKFR